MPKITWKKWRVGFWLAVLFGFLNAGAGGVAGGWKAFVAVLCSSLTTQIISYLTKSPLDDVDDGESPNQPQKPQP